MLGFDEGLLLFVSPENESNVPWKSMVEMYVLSHRIHVWYMYLHLPYFTIKNQPNVGKYTSPMDGMGIEMVPF